jgi:cytidylate kinase
MNRHAHIAIDGPVASGKTTAARAVARRLGALYLDTGAMYRAVAVMALDAGVEPHDADALLRLLSERPIRVELDAEAPLGFRLCYGGVEAGEELFGPDVDAAASVVAAQPGVRSAMVALQRSLAEDGRVVMAGRDIGTVVLPDARHKIFLTASVAARVARRHAELAAAGSEVDAATLGRQIAERDRLDQTRAVAPLRPASDATIVDSSELDAAEVVERILELVGHAGPAS